MKRKYWIVLLMACFSCQNSQKTVLDEPIPNAEIENPPEWAKEVVWYEIAVERFRNGDASNDPKAEDIVGAYPGFVPEGWTTTPWTQDWYKEDPYFSNLENAVDLRGNSIEKFVDKVQLRRYGGDLQGVLDKLDYIDSLGVTAIYFRPLNDAPSLHKYDARNWRHIDVNFGPNPSKDKQTISAETPEDPSTWKMTEADKLFLKVIDECHKRGIKILLDYSWNHTGQTFWAWKDVLEHQEQSNYKDWYWIESFDNPETSTNEFKYHGWAGVPSLPEIKETQKQDLSKSLTSFEGTIYNETTKQHIFNVAKRWLDPNGDGDPSDGVDGYRLDVAAETPLGFWREFRKQVRKINPNAYLLGEIWWEEWPDKLLDPEPFLKGDVFDAVMNYRWYRAVRHFFNESPNKILAAELIDSLNSFRSTIRKDNNYAMMNYTGGFDTPRILTSLFNKNKYKYYCKVHENPSYKIHRPDAETFQTLKLLLVQQYTYFGAPHIYAGDEMGMWGADDPSSRKPLIWPDFIFEDETTHPLGEKRPVDKVTFNDDLFQFHQQLIRIRKSNPILIHGEIEFIDIADSEGMLAYRRYDDSNEMIAIFNHHNSTKEISIPRAVDVDFIDVLNERTIENKSNKLKLKIPARTACLIKKK
ncbi:glycoside hydrolase family 13 protein [Flavobacteriaceae bacterium GF1]